MEKQQHQESLPAMGNGAPDIAARGQRTGRPACRTALVKPLAARGSHALSKPFVGRKSLEICLIETSAGAANLPSRSAAAVGYIIALALNRETRRIA